MHRIAAKRAADVSVGRVEDGRGSLGPLAIAPFPIPAHQTGRADFRHPAFRLASPQGTRRQAAHLLVSGDDTSARDGLRQAPSPLLLQKRTRSRGPLLRRHYPASTLLLPRPTPAVTNA